MRTERGDEAFQTILDSVLILMVMRCKLSWMKPAVACDRISGFLPANMGITINETQGYLKSRKSWRCGRHYHILVLTFARCYCLQVEDVYVIYGYLLCIQI